MAATPKNITETLIIPPRSRERFIRFGHAGPAGEEKSGSVLLCGLSDLKAGYLVVRPHCQHHFIGYLTRGRVSFSNGAKEDDEELKAGAVLFLQGGSFQRYTSTVAFSMVWFHLDAAHARWRHLVGRQSLHRAARCLKQVRDLMELAFAEAQSPLGATDSVTDALHRLILTYLDRELDQGDSEEVVLIRARLEKVWREVSGNLEKEWTVPTMARMAGMSVSHFHAAVSTAYGIPPMTIIRNFRMERAQALLLNTDCTLEKVAERTGYQSAFSLSRAFKAATGTSPRFYRRRELGRHSQSDSGHPNSTLRIGMARDERSPR